ncbi:MAG TPA: hypothetical protein VFU94_11725, partial [Conexibacter sp.]|nr:hypothetical protein [Conexibacter sp.]
MPAPRAGADPTGRDGAVAVAAAAAATAFGENSGTGDARGAANSAGPLGAGPNSARVARDMRADAALAPSDERGGKAIDRSRP